MFKTNFSEKYSGVLRVILFTTTFLMFFSCCFLYNNHTTELQQKNNTADITEKINHKSISAVVLTSLPFVLAIKDLIIDREEK